MSSSVESLGKAWAWVLESIAGTWIYNCDSDDSHAFCNRAAHEEGPWLVIYQPAAVGYCRMIDMDELIGHIIIKRKDRRPITTGLWKEAQPVLAEVNKLLLQSYNDILDATDGKWIRASKGTLKSILHTKKELTLEDGMLKYKFLIRQGERCCGVGWTPHRVVVFRGGSTGLPVKEELDMFDMDAVRAIVD